MLTTIHTCCIEMNNKGLLTHTTARMGFAAREARPQEARLARNIVKQSDDIPVIWLIDSRIDFMELPKFSRVVPAGSVFRRRQLSH